LEVDVRSGDIALRGLVVLSLAGFIALAASLYEVDRREKSSSATATANLTDVEHQVRILTDQIRILSNQLGAGERQVQALGSQMQVFDSRLRELQDQLRARR
jgi:peptidoglycan hydrolase CwlO-like protein